VAQPAASEFLDGTQREAVRARLQRFVAARIAADLAPIFAAEAAASGHSALRGALHELVERGGVVPGATDARIPTAERAALKRMGVRAGRFALYVPGLLKPRAAALRALLWAVRHHVKVPELPAPGLVSIAVPPDWPPGFAAWLGWIEAGGCLLRLDVAERVAAELEHATRRRPIALPADFLSRLGLRQEQLPAVLRRLGVGLLPAVALPPDQAGPPAPPMIRLLRAKAERAKPASNPERANPAGARAVASPPPRPVPKPAPQPVPSGPFAALAVLRR